MKHYSCKTWLSLLLCVVLIAALALTCTGCVDDNTTPSTDETEDTTPTTETDGTFTDGETLGEGKTSFTLIVVDAEGKEAKATIRTDKTLLGEALLEHGLIAGDQMDMGLLIKTVNGMTYDFEKDGKYWAFYIDGEYAMSGVDATEITPDAVYTLKAE